MVYNPPGSSLHGISKTRILEWLPFPPPGAFQVSLVGKNLPANEGDIIDAGSIPGLGKSPGGILQYPCLENPLKDTSVSLPGESPWTEEPSWLQSIGSKKVRHD